MDRIRVLVADDHALIRSGLVRLLDGQADMEALGPVADGHSVIRAAIDLAPDVVLLDITMPGPASTEVIRAIVMQRPTTRVLMLTMHDDPVLARAMLAAGASGYVVKLASEAEILSAIRGVHEGRTIVDIGGSGAAGQKPLEAVDAPIMHAAPAPQLSRRERQVLEQLALGCTNSDIAGQIGISVKTVETYRRRLMEKLGLKGRADLVRYALQVGILRPARVDDKTD